MRCGEYVIRKPSQGGDGRCLTTATWITKAWGSGFGWWEKDAKRGDEVPRCGRHVKNMEKVRRTA